MRVIFKFSLRLNYTLLLLKKDTLIVFLVIAQHCIAATESPKAHAWVWFENSTRGKIQLLDSQTVKVKSKEETKQEEIRKATYLFMS